MINSSGPIDRMLSIVVEQFPSVHKLQTQKGEKEKTITLLKDNLSVQLFNVSTVLLVLSVAALFFLSVAHSLFLASSGFLLRLGMDTYISKREASTKPLGVRLHADKQIGQVIFWRSIRTYRDCSLSDWDNKDRPIQNLVRQDNSSSDDSSSSASSSNSTTPRSQV